MLLGNFIIIVLQETKRKTKRKKKTNLNFQEKKNISQLGTIGEHKTILKKKKKKRKKKKGQKKRKKINTKNIISQKTQNPCALFHQKAPTKEGGGEGEKKGREIIRKMKEEGREDGGRRERGEGGRGGGGKKKEGSQIQKDFLSAVFNPLEERKKEKRKNLSKRKKERRPRLCVHQQKSKQKQNKIQKKKLWSPLGKKEMRINMMTSRVMTS